MIDYSLCVITHEVAHMGRSHLEIAQAALKGGATIIQFRGKNITTCTALEIAERIRALTREYDATFIVNDRVDIALAAHADGVHLGTDDLPIIKARNILGPNALIGASIDNPTDALAAKKAGVDYFGVGPVYNTATKTDAGDAIGITPVIGIKQATDLPILAIGGITTQNVAQVIRAGADGIAVISAIAEAPDMVDATRELLAAVHSAKS